ncbi:hypothetical protein [Pseudooceanicola sp.]|uniref:hypothetical protein n=1 Tax=Pseudooceanicola sp. TaxID=1914328 RepID=UPI004058FD84
MNSIIFTRSPAPKNGDTALYLALDRLGAWLDAERDTVGRVLAQLGRGHAGCALDALDQLHLGPESTADDLRDLLEHAQTCLSVLHETLRSLPSRCSLETAWGLPGRDTVDTHVRWSGARIEDVLATLDRALAV